MLKSKSLIAAAVAAAFALPLAAGAAGTERPGMSSSPSASVNAPSMKQLDTNNDGYVSKDEAKKHSNVSKRFKELDKDNDGKLSATELSAAEATGAGGTAKDRSTDRMGSAGHSGTGNGGDIAGKKSSAQGSATEGRSTGN